jgi:uncharacterized membrane protein YbhN (UPF0104 family)
MPITNLRPPSWRWLELRPVLALAGIATTFGFAYLAVHNVDVGAAWDAFRSSRAWWLAPALAVLALAVFVRAIRWRFLFPPARARRSARSPRPTWSGNSLTVSSRCGREKRRGSWP